MSKDKTPFLSDEFLDKVIEEINQLYGGSSEDQNNEPIKNEEV
ncbi:MAG: bacitracin ABC transporter ATP-binding protein [Bacillus sp. (in: Bacteria)]|nr:bacitracin ABC transporter ATP-binding protein [Bacillus sp. (in: firmicutes)]